MGVGRFFKAIAAFAGGFIIAYTYCYFLLRPIPFPFGIGPYISIGFCTLYGLANVVAIQLRCISSLIFPMYCGKAGRSVLKALVLTHIVAGPVSNMGLNAREVVRVFACTTQLSYNLSREKYNLLFHPLRESGEVFQTEVEKVKESFRSMNDIIEALELEIKGDEEVESNRKEIDMIDDVLMVPRRTDIILSAKPTTALNNSLFYETKLNLRCEAHLSKAMFVCIKKFDELHKECTDSASTDGVDVNICDGLKYNNMCNFVTALARNNTKLCNNQVPPSVGVGFNTINRIKMEFCKMVDKIHLNYTDVNDFKDILEDESRNVQDSKETAKKVIKAFDEKTVIMRYVFIAMNVAMALIFLKIFHAAVKYHDWYLTDIDYENIYVTSYFKRLDTTRKVKGRISLLPLKKMETNKYIDIHSASVNSSRRGKLVSQILKVMLEVVTATTFVMLDRLFFEALDMVRQHAEMELVHRTTRELHFKVEGTSILAPSIRNILDGLHLRNKTHDISSDACLPRPRQMPYIFFFKIYVGYLWILFLLLISPYTLRLRRSICSYFYPRREKQRILHLYNDILKKRLKMDKTLRRKAVQAIRAHYLTGESLLSMRMKFPQLLGWLQILPTARMTCLICGEVEPRNNTMSSRHWYSCYTTKCPFVYCSECWREIGSRCLACDPGLAELSDVDSVSEYERPHDS